MADHSEDTTAKPILLPIPGTEALELHVPAMLYRKPACVCCKHRPPATMRDFFKEVLRQLIREREGFSGKRPLGNSDWFDMLEATFDGHLSVDPSEDEKLDMIHAAIDAL